MILVKIDQLATIAAQAKKEAPNECCGMVAGVYHPDGTLEITAVYPMTNADQSPDHFSLLPEEQFKVVKDMRQKGWKLVGNYHSHLQSPARPSDEDIRLAYDSNILYFIISIEKPDFPVLNAYRIDQQSKIVTNVPIKFVDE